MAKKIKSVVVIIAVAVIAIFIIAKGNPFYIVDEGNQVVVTRFKGIVAIRTDAGLYFKIPFVDKITTYPKKILSMDGDLEEIKTKDDLRIVCDITARWKITDPKAFYKSFQKLDNGYVKLILADNTYDDLSKATLPIKYDYKDLSKTGTITGTKLSETFDMSDLETAFDNKNTKGVTITANDGNDIIRLEELRTKNSSSNLEYSSSKKDFKETQ